MRDDSHKWNAPFLHDQRLRGDGIEISTMNVERLCLISGAQTRSRIQLQLVGWPQPAAGHSYAVSLRRDRILEVNGTAREDGWDDVEGLAISTVTDAYHVFLIEGPKAMELLQRGGELSLAETSASAARAMFNLPAILYRLAEDRFVLIFARAFADAGWLALTSHLALTGEVVCDQPIK